MTEVIGHGTDPVSALMHLISADNQRWLKDQPLSKQREVAGRYFDSTGVKVADVMGGLADQPSSQQKANQLIEQERNAKQD
ncbi:hypothetical protein [Streptomyces sp. NBC_01361]|uniref:hypothetical protein n=1 Tax=Streptomyces sp. NBC_01361 TaxID=2903838 RepID=UPI002E340516|nr:hypothetical protein [Streptomyces sp. NBC_01361]